jgi:hypothetical protein
MPVIRPDQTDRPLQIGDFFVNRRSGALVEIVHVDLTSLGVSRSIWRIPESPSRT